jgi:hypothetical protein
MAKTNGTNHEQQGSQSVFPGRQSAVAIESTQKREMATAVTREIEFSVLADGRMVDLVRNIRQPSKIEFLVWQDGNIQLTSQLEHDGELLVPPKIDPTVVKALCLPTTARSCPGVRELIMLIVNAIDKYVDIRPDYSFLVAAYILVTWFADCLTVIPYLWISGPLESGKTTLLRLMYCLCRRAIIATAPTAAPVYRLAAPIRPTLLIDEARFGSELLRLLQGGDRRGSYVVANGKAFDNFCPKAIASGDRLNDAGLVSRSINVVMTPSSRNVSFLDLEAEEKLADDLQAVLETFRLANYAKVVASQHPRFAKFPPHLRDNARALAAPMAGDEELQERLARVLESQVNSMRFNRFNEPEWPVMLALFRRCHAINGLYVGRVTEETNNILRERGETMLYSPKKVGQILNNSLGFPTRRRGEGYHL